ncbi:MAG TPA: hypothetical protein VMB73_31940 [Acetobacteraceae bacterium]|jgi:DNA-binding transcriptional regulator YdaS (Cro superfamily)|nr:hypothetical protein [Acetobacteraceae bacterium]
MRQTLLSASLLAFALTVAPAALAQAVQSGTGTAATSTTPAPSATHGMASGKHLQQFKTESEAKSACGSQSVVWANTSNHVLHASGSKYYGKTKRGGYVCETTAMQSGYHMAKSGQ